VKRAVQESLHAESRAPDPALPSAVADDEEAYDKEQVIAQLLDEMREASAKLEFELAAHLRDQIATLRGGGSPATAKQAPVKYPQKRGRR